MGTFVHLNGHSEHSTDGYARIMELVAAAKANGQDALALTDTNLSGALTFRAEAQRHGIKPIIGLDVRLTDYQYTGGIPLKAASYDLTLLAENRAGWHSLIALYNESRALTTRNGAYVTHAMLARHADGLIALTGGRGGPIDSHLDEDNVDAAKDALARIESTFGRSRVFLEASTPHRARFLAGVFQHHEVHLLATGRYRQAVEADTDGRDALMLLRSGRAHMAPHGGWVVSDEHMRAQAPDSITWQNAINLTATIADAISADTIPAPERQAPSFPAPAGFRDAADYLRHLAFRGADNRYDDGISLQAIERLNVELERITDVEGATDYILTAHDLVSWCRSEGILTAPRGTSAGSLVLYCLGLTETDPLRYGLKFDRFMRAGRDEMPHVDVDIQHSRRQDAYDYLAARWPAQIARATSYIRVKGGPFRSKLNLDEETAAQLQGRIQQPTTHVCAVMIAPAALHGTVPFRIDHREDHENDLPTAAWDALELENQGYLVLNLLFSSTLDVIARTAEAVRATPAGITRLGVLLPDGDGELYADSTGAAWDLIATDDTDGVFQLGAEYAAVAAKTARPRNLTDMAVLIAVSGRPHRLEPYLAARALRTTRYGRYDHITADESEQIWLAEALDATHGVLIFKEQIMDLFVSVGGFSNAQAELAWRTLAKKDPAALPYLRTKFMEGAVQEHFDRAGDRYSPAFSEATAARVFDMLINDGAFAFTAAHAYSYARVTFQTAWLRAHFPETFQRVLDEVQPRRKRRAEA